MLRQENFAKRALTEQPQDFELRDARIPKSLFSQDLLEPVFLELPAVEEHTPLLTILCNEIQAIHGQPMLFGQLLDALKRR